MQRVGTLLLVACCRGCAGAAPPDPEARPGSLGWASGSTIEEGSSTHLFIVNRAISILGQHLALPRAARAHARLSDPACRIYWAAGLDNADHRPGYNDWYTFQSHFYDPSTGTNYLGGTEAVAYNEALQRLATARSALAGNDVENGCYQLGLALHYATDITQPMHASNFASTDYPINLHSHVEDRAVEVQAQYAVTDWNAAPTGSAGAVLSDIAWASHARWPATWNVLAAAYEARCHERIEDYTLDHTSCWRGDARVDVSIGASLRQAQIETAAFVFAADLP